MNQSLAFPVVHTHRASVALVDGPTTLAQFTQTRVPRAEPWADDFVLVRELVGAAARGRHFRAVSAGDLTRLRSGVYVPTGLWLERDDDERYRDRLRATALEVQRPVVFASASAAALWRLPNSTAWPQTPTVLAERASGGRSSSYLRVNCDGMPREIWVVDGLATTSLPRTLVDVARRGSFETAVVMTDRALAAIPPNAVGVEAFRVTTDELRSELEIRGLVHGRARVVAVIEFADGLSGSVGESVTRVTIHTLGFAAPILQQEFRDALGRMFADFWWPEFRLIGEFDGKGKYLREEFTRGRTMTQVVLAEKEREDRLRALGPSVTRFGWDVARSPASLRRQLLAAGLPLGR
jgi:hypothetical protein